VEFNSLRPPPCKDVHASFGLNSEMKARISSGDVFGDVRFSLFFFVFPLLGGWEFFANHLFTVSGNEKASVFWPETEFLQKKFPPFSAATFGLCGLLSARLGALSWPKKGSGFFVSPKTDGTR